MMSSFLDKIKIKTAVGRSNKFDLSCTHVTTQDFFSQRIIYQRELMPGQSISVNATTFTRLAPLDKPFFTGCRMVNRGFFVPYRTIFRGFNEFLTDTDYIDDDGTIKRITSVPYFELLGLSRLFFGSVGQSLGFYTEQSTPDEDPTVQHDFIVVQPASSGTSTRRLDLTASGRYVYSVLCALGYSLISDLRTQLDTSHPNFNMSVSALPIMAFIKVYLDWYTDPAYTDTRNVVLSTLKQCSNQGAGGILTDDKVSLLLSAMQMVGRSLYDRDYFTAAFDNPLVPNDGTMSGVQIPEIKDYSKTVDVDGSTLQTKRTIIGNNRAVFDSADSQTPPPYIESQSGIGSTTSNTEQNFKYRGFVGMLNQYMLDSLKALTDYVKRYQLIGSRTLDRYLAMFGIKLDSAKLDRSIYVGKSQVNIDIADVMSTSATEDATLGDYAAKGVGYKPNQTFSYKADEFGLFLIVSTILPTVGYVQGVHRMNLHIDRLDFFSPDFDALGTQAIARGELWNNPNRPANFTIMDGRGWSANAPFGYTPRYSEYAVARDFLTADFRCRRINADLGAWHTFRLFDPVNSDDIDIMQHHDENFDIAYDQQFNRIFNYKDDAADHFFVVHQFSISSRMPKKPLFEQYDFDEGRAFIANLSGTNLN